MGEKMSCSKSKPLIPVKTDLSVHHLPDRLLRIWGRATGLSYKDLGIYSYWLLLATEKWHALTVPCSHPMRQCKVDKLWSAYTRKNIPSSHFVFSYRTSRNSKIASIDFEIECAFGVCNPDLFVTGKR